jgi:aspartyl-tRNA(Asn)/glutamyl-tRNA(Gln) amidotransferase subunit B
LPEAKKKRLVEEYNISPANAEVIVSDKHLAEYFENVVSEIKEKLNCREFNIAEERCLKLAANYMVSELQKHLLKNSETVKDIKITPENYAELVAIIASGKINSSAAQAVLGEMYKTGGDPSQIIEEKGLLQMDDENVLDEIVEKVLKNNADSAKDYQSGKTNALQFLIGQVMRESKGKANPQMALDLLKKKIG